MRDNYIWFKITRLGNTVACRIDGRTLWDHFSARSSTETSAMGAFVQDRTAIEEIASKKAKRGGFVWQSDRSKKIVWVQGADVGAGL
jgi:hypothetical protein